ncbi:Transcription termination factor mitochondrial/chloroplastic [Arabidopsis thaliana x Arabidopsis arenosa]|uniref:Transcription termination factor mitochondrial/chloroplastic n=1 Tax=Arabidopsis thaliana x Arabidopsis arenosa TaxID=1240361 RepID=A0A8T1XJJ7_9BRAS|nr:Transcription termination factor mitochondrial/chloroplastic [Arabidopsis thaliana x Arabidopsis arenosa]
MAGFSLYCFINPRILFTLPSESPLFVLGSDKCSPATRRRSRKTRGFVVTYAHSNPKIINPKKKSRYGQTLSPYDSDEDEALDDESDDEDDDWLLNDDFAEVTEYEKKKPKSQKQTIAKKGGKKGIVKNWEKSEESETDEDDLDIGISRNVSSEKKKERESWRLDGRGKVSSRKYVEKLYPRLSEEIDIDPKWVPLLDYLSTFGLKESHFVQMYERHMPSLQINVLSAQERLDYLLSVGVKHRDIKRMLLRQPQILQYTVENNLKAHISFLMGLGIPNSKIGQIVAATPSLFSYSVENSLRPTIRYLIEEVGIKETDVGKVVQLSPQILVQRLDITWNTRYMFLSKELGAPRDSVVKMVKKHPQLLHYSIDDGFLPRINFLRSIGMCNSDILKVLTSLTQVLSLSLEDNLKPKYMYLVNELNNEVHILTKYPMYLSLSLDQRIRPRHRFLVELKKVRKGPFPLSSLVPNDESFCQQWAGTSVDTYLAFRQRLLLKEFANKYDKRV